MKISVYCDFDGTITNQDTTDAVLENFALPEYREWEEQWQAGVISARECMERQARLLRCGPEGLRSFLGRISIDPGIYALEKECIRNGTALIIVSDGIDFLMDEVLRARGLSHLPHYSNRLNWDENGRPFLTFPYGDPDCRGGCGVCKCRLLEQDGHPDVQTVYIGDGLSDRCVVHQADRVFAKNRLQAYCIAKGIVHDSFETLTEVACSLFGKPSALQPAIEEKR